MNLKKIKDSKISVEELRNRGFKPSGLDYLSGLNWFIVYGSKEDVQNAVRDLKESYKGQVSVKPGHLRKSNGQFEQEVRIKSSKIQDRMNLKKIKDSKISPSTWIELYDLIKERIREKGPNCNLNDIDVSHVTNMSMLFSGSNFNGDISKWDVSNVTNMRGMFSNSNFNGDISKWDVSNVTKMDYMFIDSKFRGDLSKWDVSNVTDMSFMFTDSDFSGNISKWDVSNVTDMIGMFKGSPLLQNPPSWYQSQDTTQSALRPNSKEIKSKKFNPGYNSYEEGNSWAVLGGDASMVRAAIEDAGFDAWSPEEDGEPSTEWGVFAIYEENENAPEKDCIDWGEMELTQENWERLKQRVHDAAERAEQ